MENRRLIQQTLHGYDGGHRLLASSTKLNATEERHLLEFTDLSGSRVDGFEEYLTGYPIPNSERYAFSKSWYASEMERPGCVWTQTMLMDVEDLSSIPNLLTLLNYFSRPKKGSYEKFGNAIVYEPPPRHREREAFSRIIEWQSEYGLRFYAILFNALFEKIQNVVIAANDSRIHEDAVVGIWSQLWGALRFRFSFCTASFSNKSLNREQFVFQIVPTQNFSIFRSELLQRSRASGKNDKTAIIDEPTLDLPRLPLSRYSRIYSSFERIQEGLLNLSEDEILKFVWEFGNELSPFRKNFGWLVRLFDSMDSSPEPKRLEVIAKAVQGKFPKPQEQRELKRRLFGRDTSQVASEAELLYFALFSKNADFLDANDLDIPNRLSDLWVEDSSSASRFLDEASRILSLTPLQNSFIKLSASQLTAELFTTIIERNPPLAGSLVRTRGELAATADVWRLSEASQHIVFAALVERYGTGKLTPRKKLVWNGAVTAMLDAGNDSFADKLFDLLGDPLVELILDWWTGSLTGPKGKWNRILETKEEQLVIWASKRSGGWTVKGRLALFLDPTSSIVRHYGTRAWVNLLENIDSHFSKSEKVDIQTFLLALGLSDPDLGSRELVEQTFAQIYSFAEDDKLSQKNWLEIDPFVPSGGFFFGWDKCRRLEEGLIHHIVERGWPVELLVSVGTSKKLFKRLIKRADDYSRGRHALWQLRSDINSGALKCSSSQMHVLNDYFSD